MMDQWLSRNLASILFVAGWTILVVCDVKHHVSPIIILGAISLIVGTFMLMIDRES